MYAKVKVKEIATEESAVDVVTKVSIQILFGIGMLIGALSLVTIVSGIVSVGPVQFLSAMFLAII